MTSIALVCGAFHKKEVDSMILYAKDEAKKHDLEIAEIVWTHGSMEAPLATARLLEEESILGVACLGIIEKGETNHGLVIGNSVIKSLIELQLGYDKPVGLGIIGPGALPEHFPSRLESHARGAILALISLL